MNTAIRHSIRVATFNSDADPELLRALYAFRAKCFVVQEGWDLPLQDELEIDQFDTPDTVYCALFYGDQIVAGWRGCRCDQPYLSRSMFPRLATTTLYPDRPDVFEISRFGILRDAAQELPQLAKLNYGAMFSFGRKARLRSFVAVADIYYERYLNRTLGIETRRYGHIQTIGHTRTGRPIRCVAGEIPLDQRNASAIDALISPLSALEHSDADVFRPASLSA